MNSSEKTYKRETAIAMLLFLGGMVIWGVYTPEAKAAADGLAWPIIGFVTAAFGLDAYGKQIAGRRQ